MKRRTFIRNSAILSGIASLPVTATASQLSNTLNSPKLPMGKMKLEFAPFNLQLKHVFTLATSSRSTTPVMLTAIHYEGFTGYGEASMPPYLGESQQTAAKFLKQVDLDQFSSPFLLDDILTYVDHIAPGNAAAKASIDIALHDLVGKIMDQPWHKIWGLSPDKTPVTSFTIGIDTDEVVKQKVREASPYKILKVKMGRENDKEMIKAIRSVSKVPLCVDINQGWTEKHHALEMIYWLKERGIVFIEQPMPKTSIDDLVWLREQSPLPIFADEALQRLVDVPKMQGIYDGINIKLMKCTGMREAHKMANLATALGMKVMLGCMTETSCAVSAAAQLSPLSEFADLDGNLLISNDPYTGVLIKDGKVTLNNRPGIGIKVVNKIV
ncbi:MAG: dipeptide epimerase [Bacteroidota bacterium]|nr:dipeptide epimerase [Bacteroidota bacterium]